MELEEAHRLADRYRLATFCLSDSESATVILDDRITELEAEMKQILSEFDEVETQRDELVEACKELTIESANNITNEGQDGIGANKDNIELIERITGKIWQEI